MCVIISTLCVIISINMHYGKFIFLGSNADACIFRLNQPQCPRPWVTALHCQAQPLTIGEPFTTYHWRTIYHLPLENHLHMMQLFIHVGAMMIAKMREKVLMLVNEFYFNLRRVALRAQLLSASVTSCNVKPASCKSWMLKQARRNARAS